MAGFEPASLIVEIMNEDGTMARRPQLEVFAERHGLRMGTIADLIEYRSLHEQSIELRDTKTVTTEFGEFTLHTFSDLIDDTLHFALTRGELCEDNASLVRIQTVNLLRDVVGTLIGDDTPGWSARRALERIAAENLGALVLIGQSVSSTQALADVIQYPHAPAITNSKSGGIGNYRVIGTGAQILKRIGVGKMRLMSAPIRFNALSGFSLEVTEFVQP